jgi:hypothetical protein
MLETKFHTHAQQWFKLVFYILILVLQWSVTAALKDGIFHIYKE